MLVLSVWQYQELFIDQFSNAVYDQTKLNLPNRYQSFGLVGSRNTVKNLSNFWAYFWIFSPEIKYFFQNFFCLTRKYSKKAERNSYFDKIRRGKIEHVVGPLEDWNGGKLERAVSETFFPIVQFATHYWKKANI